MAAQFPPEPSSQQSDKTNQIPSATVPEIDRTNPIALSVDAPNQSLEQGVQTQPAQAAIAGVCETNQIPAAAGISAVPGPQYRAATKPDSIATSTFKPAERSASHRALQTETSIPETPVQPAVPAAPPSVPLAVPIASPVPEALTAAVQVARDLPPPSLTLRGGTPVPSVQQKSNNSSKPQATPLPVPASSETGVPEPVSFQARLTERDPEPPHGQPPDEHITYHPALHAPAPSAQPEETATAGLHNPSEQPEQAVRSIDQTNPNQPLPRRSGQIGSVSQKPVAAAETPQESKASPEVTRAVLPLQNTTPAPPQGPVSVSSPTSQTAGIANFRQAPPAPARSSVPPQPNIETPVAAVPGAIREISVRIPTGDNPRGVEVQLVEKDGKVQVTVRSADQQVSSALRGDLSELVRMLDAKGYKTETWTPADTHPLVHAAGHAAASLMGSDTPRDPAAGQQQQQGFSGGNNPGNSQQQQRKQQQNRPAWLQELAQRLQGDA